MGFSYYNIFMNSKYDNVFRPYSRGTFLLIRGNFQTVSTLQSLFKLVGAYALPFLIEIPYWPLQDSRGRDFKVILLDSEGINAVSAKDKDDNRIFTLTVLLASVLIYNSMGVPKRTDLNDLEYLLIIRRTAALWWLALCLFWDWMNFLILHVWPSRVTGEAKSSRSQLERTSQAHQFKTTTTCWSTDNVYYSTSNIAVIAVVIIKCGSN